MGQIGLFLFRREQSPWDIFYISPGSFMPSICVMIRINAMSRVMNVPRRSPMSPSPSKNPVASVRADLSKIGAQ